MAIPNADRVQPIKFETIADGGSTDDQFPSGVKQNEDALSARGFYFQEEGSSVDENVYAHRNSGDLRLRDIRVDADWKISQMGLAVYEVPSGVSFTVHSGYEHCVHQEMIVTGEMIINGRSVIV